MSSKIDGVPRDFLKTAVKLCHLLGTPPDSPRAKELRALLAAPVVERQKIRPCDEDVFNSGESACLVDIPKETAETICRGISSASGCKVDWHYIGGRVHIKALAPPELAELQATVARQKNLLSDQELNAAALCRELQSQAAEIERLKGGQGEPVPPKDLLHRLAYAISQVGKPDQDIDYDAVILAREDLSAFRAAIKDQLAPVSVVYPSVDEVMKLVMNYQDNIRTNVTGTTNWAANLGMHIIDKVKELNQ